MNKKAKFDFRLMNSLGHLKDEEFKVAYYILNTIGMSDDGHPKIYRAVLADVCNKSERTITRITDRLNELGVIKKDVVSDGNKKYNFYCIPQHETVQNCATDDTETTQKRVTDDTFNKSNKSDKTDKSDKTEKTERLEEDVEKAKEYINQELDAVQDFHTLSVIGTTLRNYVRDDCRIPGLEEYLNLKIKEKAEDIRNSKENDVRLCEASLPSR